MIKSDLAFRFLILLICFLFIFSSFSICQNMTDYLVVLSEKTALHLQKNHSFQTTSPLTERLAVAITQFKSTYPEVQITAISKGIIIHDTHLSYIFSILTKFIRSQNIILESFYIDISKLEITLLFS